MILMIAVHHHKEAEHREARDVTIQMMTPDAADEVPAEDLHQAPKIQDQEAVETIVVAVMVADHVKIAQMRSSLVAYHGMPVRMSSANSSNHTERS